MRYFLTFAALFFTLSSFSQGIWNKAATNNIWNRTKSDSVLIVPRDTTPTNGAFYLGAPVGDYGRLAVKDSSLYYYRGNRWDKINTTDISGLAERIAIYSQQNQLSYSDIQYSPSNFTGLDSVLEFKIGSHPILTRSAKLMTSDTIVLDNNGYHAIGDYSYITQASPGGSAFASFDIATRLNSPFDWAHFYAVQARPILEGSGGITGEFHSFQSLPTHTSTGVVDTLIGMKIENPLGAGTINKNFGIYIANQTRGTDNYAIYSAGGQSLFSGPILYANSGTGAPTFITRSSGAKLILWPDLSASSVDYGIGMLSNGIWMSVRQASTSNVFAFYGGTTRGASIDGTGKAVFGSASNPSSTLQSGGSFAAAQLATTGNITLTDQHFVVRIVNSAHVITLPTATTCTGRIYKLINYNTGANVTISSVNRDGVAVTLLPNNAKWTIQSDGTNWYVIND